MGGVIVTGVDGSATARAATRKAAALASMTDAELVVVCAFDKLEVEQVEADGREYVFTTQGSAEVTAQESIRALQQVHPTLRATPLAAQGKPADVLLKVATERDAQVIVVGNKRVQGVSRLLGSVAADVAQQASCDVFIAHTHSRT